MLSYLHFFCICFLLVFVSYLNLYLYKRKMCRDWLCGQFPHHQRDIPRVLCPTMPYYVLCLLYHITLRVYHISPVFSLSYITSQATSFPQYSDAQKFHFIPNFPRPLLLYHYHASFYFVFPIYTLIVMYNVHVTGLHHQNICIANSNAMIDSVLC